MLPKMIKLLSVMIAVYSVNLKLCLFLQSSNLPLATHFIKNVWSQAY